MPYTEHKGHPSHTEDHDDTLKTYTPATRRQRGAPNMSLLDTLQRAVRTPTLNRIYNNILIPYKHIYTLLTHQMCDFVTSYTEHAGHAFYIIGHSDTLHICTPVKRRQHGAPNASPSDTLQRT